MARVDDGPGQHSLVRERPRAPEGRLGLAEAQLSARRHAAQRECLDLGRLVEPPAHGEQLVTQLTHSADPIRLERRQPRGLDRGNVGLPLGGSELRGAAGVHGG